MGDNGGARLWTRNLGSWLHALILINRAASVWSFAEVNPAKIAVQFTYIRLLKFVLVVTQNLRQSNGASKITIDFYLPFHLILSAYKKDIWAGGGEG